MENQGQDRNNQTAGEATQQPEKLFTQDEVNRIVGERLSRVKQDADSADTYRRERDTFRQERDDARRELEQYKNNAFLKSRGVRDEDLEYVTFKAEKLVDDKTDFQKAAETVLAQNPRFLVKGYRVVSMGKPDGGPGSESSGAAQRGANDSDAIRKAMGLKG